jgi:hypothetical protein
VDKDDRTDAGLVAARRAGGAQPPFHRRETNMAGDIPQLRLS